MLNWSCKHSSLCHYTALSVVDGGWSDWTDWTSCDAPCGGGMRDRSRECNNPPPQYGGKECAGSSNETEHCNEHECPSKPPSK